MQYVSYKLHPYIKAKWELFGKLFHKRKEEGAFISNVQDDGSTVLSAQRSNNALSKYQTLVAQFPQSAGENASH